MDDSDSLATKWDKFYKSKGVKFYKDRNWLRRECLELMPEAVRRDPRTWCAPLTAGEADHEADDSKPTAKDLDGKCVGIEVGCGCGSAALPVLRANADVFIFATDFADEAVALLKQRDEYVAQSRCRPRRMYAWVGDVSDATGERWAWLEALAAARGGLEFATMVFVLSALSRADMPRAILRVAALLKPGGLLFFRDYGSGDLAQQRLAASTLARGGTVDGETYERGEGTLSHYFSLDECRELFDVGGLQPVEVKTVDRDITNRKKSITMNRVWIQAKFVKADGRPVPRPINDPCAKPEPYSPDARPAEQAAAVDEKTYCSIS
eukprot:CAMPEP_0184103614 /NCGR_PEP_ID=MMETSP0974-20121125/13942_1 /TAXON_ID=483370 /ORGANISM="non described non described, Strain CCMP2097" /LENGTH=322 /DNA_ID=CAMNT_0026406585 /DNA_START=1 /DNA_END=969 /DNA_ORIENTATION=-